MRDPGVVRTVVGALAAGAVIAWSTGCGSVSGGGAGQGSDPVPYSPSAEFEPTAAAASGDSFSRALSWPIVPGRWATLAGQLSSAEQVDIYDIGPVRPGDRVRVEVGGSAQLDAAIAIFDENHDLLIANDDRSFYGGLIDPLAEAIVLHSSGNCYVAVSASPLNPTSGAYTLEVLLTEDEPTDAPEPQHVYLNFDGGQDVSIGSRPLVDVPVFDAAAIDPAYADYTDQTAEDILAIVRADYVGLNVRFHSSRAGPPPEEPYSTLHFGTFDPDLLGVAENIDEYNADDSQEAIVFVDTFAAFAVLDPSVEEITQALANVASHEVGHLLGLYHSADPRGVMDVTATLNQMLTDQSFARSTLYSEVFSLGYQNALQMLVENVGGDLDAAKQAASAQRARRSTLYDADSGPPARADLIFGTCPH